MQTGAGPGVPPAARARHRAAALERAEATSDRLLRAVSHDLRTPLATMRTAVDGLVTGAPPRRGGPRGPRRRGRASTDQLERLIDNLLDLSRLQTGLLRPLLARAQPRRGGAARRRRAPAGAVVLELDESAPMVLTDAGLLERVVANLVVNAVRVSAGTPVRVLAQVLAERCTIRVSTAARACPPAAGADVRAFQRSTTPVAGGSASAGGGARTDRGDRGTLTAEDTPGGD